MSIQEVINLIKSKENLSKGEIAERLNVNNSYISDMIAGRKPVTLDMIERIKKVFPYCTEIEQVSLGKKNIAINKVELEKNSNNIINDMKDTETLQDRLLEFVKYLNLTNQNFEKKAGLPNGFINKAGKYISEKSEAKIKETYPELNISWLLTGVGYMLKEDNMENLEIKKIRENLGLNQTEFGKLLGISKNTVSNWENKNTEIPKTMQPLIAKITEEHSQTDSNIIELKESNNGIPMFDVCAIGGYDNFESALTQEHIIGRYKISFIRQNENQFILPMRGDSMLPYYKSGDYLICEKLESASFVQSGKRYLVATTSHGLIVKRVQENFEDKTVTLISDNKEEYSPFTIPMSEVCGYAKILMSFRLEE
ncbi:MAG: helix-turn-helix domain-containing protein [Clostridia bacterium]|nr:helix-turn-helix domain-containing protein [Bacteroidales bacterium]MBR1654456.1 helix-turn-helix domain-containing protein [Clostridia bacterium]